MDPWSPEFSPPLALDTKRVHLEPLAPAHVEIDYAALMSSHAHLRRTLRWSDDWPRPDFTLAENLADLERHWREFEAREAYAYTVLTPDRETCVGCIYVKPPGRLFYWVIESELERDLDRHLLEAVLGWFESDWPFATVAVPTRVENERGAAVARAVGLDEAQRLEDGHRVFLWRRDCSG